MAVLLAAFVPLTIASRDLHQSADGTSAVLALALAAVGVVVARRQRRNPVGWLLIVSGLASMLITDVELYVVLDYRIHHGTLPLGPAAAFWVDGLWALGFLIGTPALILLPDGDPPSPGIRSTSTRPGASPTTRRGWPGPYSVSRGSSPSRSR
jgi:MYXO-CTERM domain-containing protein